MSRPDLKRGAVEAALAARATERILGLAGRARADHPDEWAAGREWYAVEAARLEGMALVLGVPAGILKAAAAVLSPGNSWSVLLERLPLFAEAVCRADFPGMGPSRPWPPVFPTYARNREKAVRLLLGAGIPAVEVSGRKVWPFYAALSGDKSAVVLDRHSSRHALGKEVLGAVEHRAAVEGFRRAAAVLGIAPRDLQAALWTVDVGAGGDTGGARAKGGTRGLGGAE